MEIHSIDKLSTDLATGFPQFDVVVADKRHAGCDSRMTMEHLSYGLLSKLGHSPNDIRSHVAEGRLTKLRRGTYLRHPIEDELVRHVELLRATAPLVDPRSAFSHISAAVCHGLPARRSDLGRATMTRMSAGHGNSTSELIVRRTRLDEEEVTTINGLRVTSLARTVADQARLMPFEWGVITADAALRQGLSHEDFALSLDRHPRLHGLRRARQVLDFASPTSESAAESLSRVGMLRAGLPAPIPQFEIYDANGEFVARVDFAWPELGLVAEVDGKAKYGDLLRPGQTSADVVMAEKRREERIREMGYWLIRWDWSVANNPEELRRRFDIGCRHARPIRSR